MKRIFAYKLFALLVLVAAIESRAQGDQDAFAGIWNLNVEKSHLDPKSRPKAETITVIAGGTTTIEGISHTGKPYKHSYPFSNGKPVPFSDRKYVTVTETISGAVMDRTTKMYGKVASKQRGEVSRDGKIVTFTVDYKDHKDGRPVHEIYLYEKK